MTAAFLGVLWFFYKLDETFQQAEKTNLTPTRLAASAGKLGNCADNGNCCPQQVPINQKQTANVSTKSGAIQRAVTPINMFLLHA
ncbi:hypothetical protein [Phytopseudomonas punonensis]|uniref:hypothetical protein n=1 Tax=Phytopseudomonas punonensis TaxID=1220495 RepID=UPI00111474D5|nr:hypothetical protein [Pseudomonas punonensis]